MANEPTEDWYWEEAEGDREGNAIDGPVMVRGFGTFGGGEGGRKTERGFDQVRSTAIERERLVPPPTGKGRAVRVGGGGTTTRSGFIEF